MSTLMQPSSSKNVNEIWKELHPMFKSQLRSYILSNNKQKLNHLANELNFNTLQTQLLFDAIHVSSTHMSQNAHQLKQNKRQITNGKRRRRNAYRTCSPLTSDIDSDPSKKRRKTNDVSKKRNNVSKMEKHGIFVVETITGHRNEGNNVYKYKVKWLGYEKMTWEPKEHLEIKTIKKYWKNKGFKMNKFGNVKPIKSESNHNTNNNTNDFENSYSFEMECHVCKMVFTDYNLYKTHLKEHFDNDANKKWLFCDFGCLEQETETPKKSKQFPNFLAHISKHTNSKPFKCNVMENEIKCVVSKSTKQQLKDHWNQTHLK